MGTTRIVSVRKTETKTQTKRKSNKSSGKGSSKWHRSPREIIEEVTQFNNTPPKARGLLLRERCQNVTVTFPDETTGPGGRET